MNRKNKRPAIVKPRDKRKNNNLNNITLNAQRQRLLEWLRKNSITTIQARNQLNILAPAARIFELRHNLNYNIQTFWTEDVTSEGHEHRVAKYVLLSGEWSNNNSLRRKNA